MNEGSAEIPFRTSLRNAREFVSKQKGTLAPMPMSEEEMNPELQDDLSLQAHALESMERSYRVAYTFPTDAPESEFRFFEDGRQRTLQIGFIPVTVGPHQVIVPVHYFIVAAVILERTRKELKAWRPALIRKGIFVEKSLVPDQSLLKAYETAGLEVIDTETTGGDYYALKKAALRKAKDLRLGIEERLIAIWRREQTSSSDFLIVDGTLMNLRNEESIRRCVGVSKSFGSRYFDVSSHNRIMRMPEFNRSWTFRFHDPESENSDQRMGSRERISWYLRLRVRPNTDPEFGLVRVEVSKHYMGEAAEYADRFSRSLISERLPTSYPAPRWHNHLFPICGCESYLRSIIPSIKTINASMKG
jgi:hypothetical protein